MPSKKSIRNQETGDRKSRKNGEQTVRFARQTSSGRHIDLPKEDTDMPDELPGDSMNYTVHIPLTPDNQPMPLPSSMNNNNNTSFTTRNAYCPNEHIYEDDTDELNENMADAMDKPWEPLSRKLSIPASIISPYRYYGILRFSCFFL